VTKILLLFDNESTIYPITQTGQARARKEKIPPTELKSHRNEFIDL